QEISLEYSTSHPGWGDDSPERKAIAILLRDHALGDRAGYACWRMSYGFSKQCETFLRTVLEQNPNEAAKGQACLLLAQFLNARLRRIDLIDARPDMAKRYEGMFGKHYIDAMRRQDRAKAGAEIEALFEWAAKQYGDVKLHYGVPVGVRAKAEL